MRYFLRLFTCLFGVFLVSGCEESGAAVESKVRDEQQRVVESTDKKAAAFTIRVNATPRVALGKTASAKIVLTPNAPYKINVEYPLKVTINPPANARLKKSELGVKDAKRYAKDGMTMPLAFSLTKSGKTTFSGELKFSVCTKTTCELKRESIAWTTIGHE